MTWRMQILAGGTSALTEGRSGAEDRQQGSLVSALGAVGHRCGEKVNWQAAPMAVIKPIPENLVVPGLVECFPTTLL